MAAGKTWILTGSLENFRINVERGFDVIGFKERRRNQAEQMQPGDEIVFYVTGVQEFGGIAARHLADVRGPDADLAAGEEEATRALPVAGRRGARGDPRRGGLRACRRAGRGARARRQVAGRALAPRLPGPASHGRRGATRSCCASGSAQPDPARGPRGAPPRQRRERRAGRPAPSLHRRGGERRPAHPAAAAAEAARRQRPAHRRGGPRGPLRTRLPPMAAASPASRSARRSSRCGACSARSAEAGIVLRDIDRGLIDFPAIVDGREVYLCWELGEDEVDYWHDPDAGFGGRQPLELSRAPARAGSSARSARSAATSAWRPRRSPPASSPSPCPGTGRGSRSASRRRGSRHSASPRRPCCSPSARRCC